MQLDPFAAQEQISFSLTEEKELEHVGLVPLVGIKPTALFGTFRRIQQKVHAARSLGIFQEGNPLRRVAMVDAVVVFTNHNAIFFVLAKITQRKGEGRTSWAKSRWPPYSIPNLPC